MHVCVCVCARLCAIRWAAVPEEDWPTEDTARDVVLADWDMSGTYGDRRQEIVFIGVGMDQDKICEQVRERTAWPFLGGPWSQF